jgi:hypothetical protein
MTPFWEVPGVLLALLSWMSAPPTSLAEASGRESLRRMLTAKATGAFTNQDLPNAPVVVSLPPTHYVTPQDHLV